MHVTQIRQYYFNVDGFSLLSAIELICSFHTGAMFYESISTSTNELSMNVLGAIKVFLHFNHYNIRSL